MSEIKTFLNLPYSKLEELNLEMKDHRRNMKNDNFFRQHITRYLVDEKSVKAVTVCFSDLEGKFVTLDYDKAFLLASHNNMTFDGSSIRGFSAQKESDLFLKIDWSSFRWLPSDVFGGGKLVVFANIHDQDGNSYESDFRGMLKNLASSLWEKEQMMINIAPEIEGFLMEGTNAEQNFVESNGFNLVTNSGYFHSLPQDKLRRFIDSVAEAKRAMGFENEKDHPEVAPSQFELNYKYTDAVQACDQIQLYKLTCRQIANSMGCTASFLPKPMMNINGSGMHTNISISKDKQNIFFANNKEKLSDFAKNFALGILDNAKDMCLLLNSSVNSYRRLDPRFEAPNEIKMSYTDRGSMIRVPLGNEKSARIEVRSVAPDCNPYLAVFALLKAGLYGVANPEKCQSVLNKREKLPGNIYDAMRYFKVSKFMEEVIGVANQDKILMLKKMSADRCPRDMGTRVKTGEVIYHHDVTNQYIWNKF